MDPRYDAGLEAMIRRAAALRRVVDTYGGRASVATKTDWKGLRKVVDSLRATLIEHRTHTHAVGDKVQELEELSDYLRSVLKEIRGALLLQQDESPDGTESRTLDALDSYPERRIDTGEISFSIYMYGGADDSERVENMRGESESLTAGIASALGVDHFDSEFQKGSWIRTLLGISPKEPIGKLAIHEGMQQLEAAIGARLLNLVSGGGEFDRFADTLVVILNDEDRAIFQVDSLFLAKFLESDEPVVAMRRLSPEERVELALDDEALQNPEVLASRYRLVRILG